VSERDNNPKPLPDDFGMTMPGIRPNKQPQQNPDNFDLTVPNLRLPNQQQSQPQTPPAAPPDDFGMTMPGIPRNNAPRNLPPDDFDLTSPNIRREPPSDVDFGSTMSGGYSNNRNEPDFGATMPYISLPENERRQYRETTAPVTAPPKKEDKRAATGIPLWLWITSGSLAFLAFLLIAGIALWFVFWRDTGFTLVVKNAPVGSTVFVDNQRCGERSGDTIKCFGLEAGKPRTMRVTLEGYTDYTETIRGENGEEFDVTANMAPKNVVQTPPQQNNCDDPDPRVAQAECRALDELDKLVAPFTVDDLVRVLNLQIINFDTNKFDIPEKRRTFLRKAAQKFNQLQGTPVVEIGGHTDNDGNVDANLILSQNRANAVRNFLSGAGVSESMLTIKPYGATKPIADNKTDDGKFKNRRIQYTVIQR
jgi:outer membrane protein OmpA-like peptidoglycan-associated protein